MSKTLDVLRNAGANLDALSDAERGVLASLSEGEISVITSVQARLNAVAAEVEGQSDITNVFC
ncbi:aroma-sacti cluster domain-containing protein [Kitasatospora sp. NPDC057198]|uniref:aroma-sacti cluster domain-containing protein n=1 Tax=Kitasatospora sp. NPDC057198 TaxID=3346046 RepID=UPI00362E00CD